MQNATDGAGTLQTRNAVFWACIHMCSQGGKGGGGEGFRAGEEGESADDAGVQRQVTAGGGVIGVLEF